MPRYMALFVGSPEAFALSGWDKLDDGARKEREIQGMKAWGDWHEQNKSKAADEGGPLGKTKRVDSKGVSDISNNVAGYMIVEADSHDAAAQLFLNHPHFAIFPGDAVEIMPCNPIPRLEDIQ
ncbi:hypothetical protein [Candidatus Viadribacter manganicus]|uniref:YCII-related domain-containing protein n=1 Tax=Candidatus Viadribacter manganicus TaxID=1759059 RepID=A0A1B1AK66_9PROT|nr:hypothetical protein [Candidatus Viadribacter manganicus]ANP46966.1 hypothetical protein ATE48_14100 [Candidatus Viadribacter manganicus]